MSGPADVVYGRRPVAEARRGRRRVLREWTADDTDAGELTRLAGSPGHQGVVAEVEPYPYADPRSLLSAEDALVIALDQVQDPHNLGAVCRTAEAAGAAGVLICERRAVGVTPAVCKASAGAVEHLAVARVTNLSDWLGWAAGAGAWSYGADAEAPRAYTEVELGGRVVLVLGSEGGGLRRRVAAGCDVSGLDPDPRPRRFAERLRRRFGARLRGGPPAASSGIASAADASRELQRNLRVARAS